MPSLPQKNTPAELAKRVQELQAKQNRYQWKYDYNALPEVPMAGSIGGTQLPVALTPEQLPPVGWIGPVVERAVTLYANNILNDDGAGRSSVLQALVNTVRAAGLDLRGALKPVKNVTPESVINDLTNFATYFSIPTTTERPHDLRDYQELYKTIQAPKISAFFRDDAAFGLIRLAGQNPVVVEKLRDLVEVVASFPVTDPMLQAVPGCAEDSLREAADNGRLFIADYRVLAGLRNSSNGDLHKYGGAPKALFVVPKKVTDLRMSFLPVAIQTDQMPGVGVSVYTPADDDAWEIAKALVQTADFSHHELITHLALTHLQMERFAVATHRCLSESHPLYALLIPHFQGTLFINHAAELALVNDGGPFEKMFFGSMASNRALVGVALNLNFNDEIFPKKLAARGVNTNILQYYPYRDDGMLIWNAVHQWVESYLNLYFESDQDIVDDTELQSWADELVVAGRVVGFGNGAAPGARITTRVYLVDVVTQIIFTGSAQHAAVNFPQSDFSGYPPNMPASLFKSLPIPQDASFQDWLDHLPPLNLAELQILVTHILTATIYGRLGYYDRTAFTDPRVKKALDQFQTNLSKVDHKIRLRMQNDRTEGIKIDYSYLLPENIPASINI